MSLDTVAPITDTMSILGLGMLGIFIVTGAIIITITLLNIITNPIKKRKNSGDKA